jgi:hypothetical protein
VAHPVLFNVTFFVIIIGYFTHFSHAEVEFSRLKFDIKKSRQAAGLP